MVEREQQVGDVLPKKRIFSKMVPLGRGRTYFFDVKESKNQEKYLIISESRLINGTWEKSRLILFPDVISPFASAMREAVTFLKEPE